MKNIKRLIRAGIPFTFDGRVIKIQADNDPNNITPEEQEMYDKLIQTLTNNSYPQAVQFIDEVVKDPKLKFLLGLGFGGPLADVHMSSSLTNLPVRRLMPTQNEIDIDKSLKFPLTNPGNVPQFFSGGAVTIVAPIVTYAGNYIIDGHHRWSQAFCANKECTITAVNFDGNLSPISILKAAQATIGKNLGRVPTQTVNGQNMFTASENFLFDYVMKNICDASTQEFVKGAKLATPEELESLSEEELKERVANYITDNCMYLIGNNTPIANAPKRDIMPQTDEDNKCIPDMAKGITEL